MMNQIRCMYRIGLVFLLLIMSFSVRSQDLSELNQNEQEKLKLRAEIKIKDFSNYLKIISNDYFDSTIVERAINQVLRSFESTRSPVEISNANARTIKTTPVIDYLHNLGNTSYDSVSYTISDVNFIGDIVLQNDEWQGRVQFQQIFEGYQNQIRQYSDTISKYATIVFTKGQGKSTSFQPLILAINKVHPDRTNDPKELSLDEFFSRLELTADEQSTLNALIQVKPKPTGEELNEFNSRPSAERVSRYLNWHKGLLKDIDEYFESFNDLKNASIKNPFKLIRTGTSKEDLIIELDLTQLNTNIISIDDAWTVFSSSSYWDRHNQFYLSIFQMILQKAPDFINDTEAEFQILGITDAAPIARSKTYQGESLTEVAFFNLVDQESKTLTLDSTVTYTNEILAFLRAYDVSKTLSDKFPSKRTALLIKEYPTTSTQYRGVKIRALIPRLYADFLDELSVSEQQEISENHSSEIPDW